MKTRIIHTKFWADSYIQSLKPTEKLLFIFLLSNESVNMVGAYEMNIGFMQYLTGINSSDIEKSLAKFQTDSKIIYLDNYVILLNHLKYQDYSKGSDKQKRAFEREKNLLPDRISNLLDNRDNLTSSELVKDQSQTIHKSKIKNQKLKIKNHKEGKIVKKEEEELKQVVDFYNTVFDKAIRSTKGFESNFTSWREVHSLDKILRAIQNARRDNFWKNKLTLQILFRQRNPRGEAVDYIEDLANRGGNNGGGNIAIL